MKKVILFLICFLLLFTGCINNNSKNNEKTVNDINNIEKSDVKMLNIKVIINDKTYIMKLEKNKTVDEFIEEGVIPDRILAIVDEDVNSNNFISRKYNIVLGNIFDIIDHEFVTKEEETAEEG